MDVPLVHEMNVWIRYHRLFLISYIYLHSYDYPSLPPISPCILIIVIPSNAAYDPGSAQSCLSSSFCVLHSLRPRFFQYTTTVTVASTPLSSSCVMEFWVCEKLAYYVLLGRDRFNLCTTNSCEDVLILSATEYLVFAASPLNAYRVRSLEGVYPISCIIE